MRSAILSSTGMQGVSEKKLGSVVRLGQTTCLPQASVKTI